MTTLLEVRELSRDFGGLRAVDRLTMSVERGAVVGLIGPNGAGKTTTFNLVTGQLRPTTGQVFFKGRRVTGMAPWDLVRLGLARTFQSTVLYSDSSVLENVMRGCAARAQVGFAGGLLRARGAARHETLMRERAEALIGFMELGGVRDELARNLPYGYQRALGIAIGLATEPELLMLDEPVAGMNPEETARMAQLIRRVNEAGATIVVVDHDMSFVMRLCQRIVVMNYGRKIAEGTPEAIREDPAVIAAYLGVDDDAPA